MCKTIPKALKYYNYDRDCEDPATVQDLADLCQEHTATPELRAEIDAWNRGTPITASSKLLCQAIIEGFEDLVENLAKRVTITKKCLDEVIYQFNAPIARIVLANMGEITDEMMPRLTDPQLVALAIPYLRDIDLERVVLNCKSRDLRMLSEYGFDVRSPKVFSVVLARYERNIEPLRFLTTVSTATPKELSELENCRESEWYWKCQATEEEKDALVDNLKSNLRARVAMLLSSNDHEAECRWDSFGQTEVDELPLLPAWLIVRILLPVLPDWLMERLFGRTRAPARPIWRNGEVKKAFRAELAANPDSYVSDLCGWLGF
jgi:hypothetical protein